jgi:hypothetical protein
MAVPENNAVTWDALWRLIYGIAAVIIGWGGIMLGMIRSKASAKVVDDAHEAIYEGLGNAASKGELKAMLDGHYKDDDDRFEVFRDRFVRMEDRTRQDMKDVADRLEGRMDKIEENQRNNTTAILTEIRNGRK